MVRGSFRLLLPATLVLLSGCPIPDDFEYPAETGGETGGETEADSTLGDVRVDSPMDSRLDVADVSADADDTSTSDSPFDSGSGADTVDSSAAADTRDGGGDTCTPPSCALKNCGTVTDSCGGGSLRCGPDSCAGSGVGATCGGGGVPNVCGCTPVSCPAGRVCGSIDNGCGSTLSCGTCPGACSADGHCIAAIDLVANGNHSCVVLADKSMWCWGSNDSGEGGTGVITSDEPVPTMVSGLSNVAQIAVGSQHTCAVLTDGTLKCWGFNLEGQLGDATRVSKAVPTTILTGVASVAAGGGNTCAVMTDGTAKCWGQNPVDQIGNPAATNPQTTPLTVMSGGAPLGGIASIATKAGHTCAISTTGTAWCWGINTSGEVGDATTSFSRTPVVVAASMSRIALGPAWTCSISAAGGTVYCWGKDLGSGAMSTTPTALPAAAGAVDIQISEASYSATPTFRQLHACIAVSDGTAKCWGNNTYWAIGDGTALDRAEPTLVSGLTGVQKVAVGAYHSCALAGGGVKCWGDPGYGRLGDGGGVVRMTPYPVKW